MSYTKNWTSMADPAIVKEVCRFLRQMRLNKNLSQEELAHRSGISRITIARMEAGRAANLITIVQLLRAMDELDRLNAFAEEEEISPMKMLREQEAIYKKAAKRISK